MMQRRVAPVYETDEFAVCAECGSRWVEREFVPGVPIGAWQSQSSVRRAGDAYRLKCVNGHEKVVDAHRVQTVIL